MFRLRLALTFCAAALVGSAWGCRATVENPIEVSQCSPTDITAVTRKSCGTRACHDGTTVADESDLDSELDLVTDTVDNPLTKRVLSHCATGDRCTTFALIDTGSPDDSYFLKKLENDPTICGDPMPNSTTQDFTVDDLACLKAWIESMQGATPAVCTAP
jgi:hypothetical protein